MIDWLGAGLVVAGTVFFVAGTTGLLRFPDVYSRLHALSKADNLGLGLLVIGLALGAGSLLDVVHLLVIWLLVLVSSATTAHVIARRALQSGISPWTRSACCWRSLCIGRIGKTKMGRGGLWKNCMRSSAG